MRVAIVYHYFLHYRKRVIEVLANDDEIDYTFCSGINRDIDIPIVETTSEFGQRLICTGKWKTFKNRWLRPGVAWQSAAIKIALSKDYDAVIYVGHMYYPSTWIAAIISRLKGKRVLMWTHGLLRRESGLRGKLRIAFYSLANALLVYGNRARSLLIESGFSPAKIHVVFNSLDYDDQLKIRHQLCSQALGSEGCDSTIGFVNPHLPTVLFIGRLTPQKKLGLLLESVAFLQEESHFVNVLFVGEGSEAESLGKECRALELEDNVIFYGSCYDEEIIGELIYHSAVCVAPGEIGLTAIHCMTYGTPAITHNDFDHQMPEYEAIEPGVTGDFFERSDVNELAKAIRKWTTPRSQREQEQIRENCFRVVDERYNPHVQREIFAEAVNGLPPRMRPF